MEASLIFILKKTGKAVGTWETNLLPVLLS